MIAYHGKQEVKDKYVARMQAHMDADELVRGVGFENGRGCAVGCTLNNYEHELFETELGIPEWAAHLLDRLHENTSEEVWPTLSMQFLEAIPIGADLSPVRNKINIFMLDRSKERVAGLDDEAEEVKAEIIAAIEQVKALHLDELRGVTISSAAWSAARSAARSAESVESAAESAAWSAAWSAVESAAESAARSAARSAESVGSAAESAARSAARSAVWSAEYDAIAAEFIRLLKELAE